MINFLNLITWKNSLWVSLALFHMMRRFNLVLKERKGKDQSSHDSQLVTIGHYLQKKGNDANNVHPPGVRIPDLDMYAKHVMFIYVSINALSATIRSANSSSGGWCFVVLCMLFLILKYLKNPFRFLGDFLFRTLLTLGPKFRSLVL